MNQTEPTIGVLITDRDLVVRVWDEWVARATGIPCEQARGQSLAQLFPELEGRGLLARFHRALGEGTVEVLAPSFHRYLFACAPSAPSSHFERMQQYVTIAPLRENDGVVGVIVTVEDVTARLDRERELAAQLASPDEATRLQAAQALGQQLAPVQAPQDLVMTALGDENWRVRRAAVSGLGQPGSPQIVAALLRALRQEHHNFSFLSSALQVLRVSDEDILGPLSELLEDPDADLRAQVALILGERGDKRAGGALLRALQDKDVNVRFHAIEALGKLGAREAVDALIEVAESGDFYLACPALDALAAMEASHAAGRIVPLLADESLQAHAAEVLGRLGDEETVVPLAALLNQPHAPAEAVSRALAAIYAHYEQSHREGGEIATLAAAAVNPTGAQNLLDALDRAGADALPDLALVLGWLEGPAVERALTRLMGLPGVRKEVVEALVRYGERVTALLVEQLAAEDLDTRQAAVIALGRIGDAGATPALLRLLAEDPELTIVVVGALAKLGDPRAFEPLLGMLGHPSAPVRQAAISALNSLGHPDTAARILTRLTHADPRVRESAVKIAGYFGYAECTELMLERCRDAEESVRAAAVEHLPYLDDPRAFPELVAALRQETPRVRAAAARALGYWDEAEAWPYLREALADADPWVRYFAVRSVSRFGGALALRGAVERLAETAQTDAAFQVRIAAVEALGKLGAPEAIAALLPLAGADDLDLARAVIHALGTVGHAQARETLLALRHSPDAERRLAAVEALAHSRWPSAVEALQWSAAADPDERVAQAAIDGLAQTGSAESVTALLALAVESARGEACIGALAQLGETQTGELARGLAHARPEARRATVEALGRINRSRAAEYLQVALNDPDRSVRLAAIHALGQGGR